MLSPQEAMNITEMASNISNLNNLVVALTQRVQSLEDRLLMLENRPPATGPGVEQGGIVGPGAYPNPQFPNYPPGVRRFGEGEEEKK